MTLEDLISEWAKDADIDTSELLQESRKTGQLHSKYYRLLLEEKAKLAKLRASFKQLEIAKWTFLTQGTSKEDGWKLPPKGMVLKNEADRYLQADPDIIEHSLKIEACKEKVDFLIDIIKAINSRNWQIRNMIDYLKFINPT